LVLIGGLATDDPEGQEVHREVERKAKDLEDTHIIVDAPDILLTLSRESRMPYCKCPSEKDLG